MTKPRTHTCSRNPSTKTARKQPAAQTAAPPAGPDRVGYLHPQQRLDVQRGVVRRYAPCSGLL